MNTLFLILGFIYLAITATIFFGIKKETPTKIKIASTFAFLSAISIIMTSYSVYAAY